MIAAATTPITTPRLSLADERFHAFAEHLVDDEAYDAQALLRVIEKPQKWQDDFVRWLCGVNTDKWDASDTWEAFLAANLQWTEKREIGMRIDTPQLVVDLTDVPEDERPRQGEKVSFLVRAYDRQLCPDAFGTWTLLATAFLEERYGRPCVIWEIEQTF